MSPRRWGILAFVAGAAVALLRIRPVPPAVRQAGLDPERPGSFNDSAA